MTFLWYISLQHQQKVAVLGAAGGIGQPMSLLMKESPAISHLALYDIVNTPGRQFKPAFAEISSLLHWNNEEYRDRTVWKLNWDLGKNIIFFQKDLFGAGRRGLFEGSRKIFKQSPSPHSKRDHRQIMK